MQHISQNTAMSVSLMASRDPGFLAEGSAGAGELLTEATDELDSLARLIARKQAWKTDVGQAGEDLTTTRPAPPPERPQGLEEGAVHESQVEKLDGLKIEKPLVHPGGDRYKLSKKQAANFHGKPVAKVLPPGTKIYRIIGEDGIANGPYWAYQLPVSKSQWRSIYAVKKIWNENGYYVEYIVPKDQKICVWEGMAASQDLKSRDFIGWLQQGGGTQLYIPSSGKQIPKDLFKRPTEWEEK